MIARPSIHAVAFVVVVMLASLLAPARSARADKAPLPDLVGTWITTTSPEDGSPSFPQLLTFNLGGTAMQAAAGPPIPALGNPGFGVWKRLGRNTFEATVIQLTYDETLQLNGSLKITMVITVNETSHKLTTVDTVTIYDVDGTEIVTLSGSQVGRRLHVDPLD
jgi:hypothetical protein